MTQSVRCHDEVVPLELTNLVIEGRDVYTPFYVAVQVVRNFNGEEIMDEVPSPTSSLICAGAIRVKKVLFKNVMKMLRC